MHRGCSPSLVLRFSKKVCSSSSFVQDRTDAWTIAIAPSPTIHKPSTFVTPFTDPTRNSSYRPLHVLRGVNDPPCPFPSTYPRSLLTTIYPASTGEDPPTSFDVVPASYEKKLPIALRKESITHFAKHLQRALLSSHGHRSGKSEESIWKSLGSKGTTSDQRYVLSLPLSTFTDVRYE